MCMFSLVDFLYLIFFFVCFVFAGGGRGVWVATKWDFFFFFFFLGGGGGHVWSTHRLRLRLEIVSEVEYTQV